MDMFDVVNTQKLNHKKDNDTTVCCVKTGRVKIWADYLFQVMLLIILYSPQRHYVRTWGTGMIASSSTFRPHPGRVIRDLFRLFNAVYGIVRKH